MRTGDFASPSRQDWEAEVLRVLNRRRPEGKELSIEQAMKRLTTTTVDGLTIDPLYTKESREQSRARSSSAEADAGAFRRLPDPTEADGEETRGRRRFADLSRLQSAVATARSSSTRQSDPTPRQSHWNTPMAPATSSNRLTTP